MGALRLGGKGSVRQLGLGWVCRVRSEPRAVPGDVQGAKNLSASW